MENKKVIIATHVYATGPAHDLRDYLLKNQIGELFFIGHPLFFDEKLKGSGYELYQNGQKVEEKYSRIRKFPEIVSYLKDFSLDVFFSIQKRKGWNLYVGNDNLNAASGVLLKWLGIVKKTVYYVIDYNPKRFPNKLLNRIYHCIDQFCVKFSDETWNLSPRMAQAREEYFRFRGGRQVVVPVGVWFERIKRAEFDQIEKHTLVFMGHVTEKQGIQYVMRAVPRILKKIPDFKFLVIGGGNYLEELKRQAKDLKIENCVEFTDFIEKHEEIEDLLVKCGLAVCLYEKYDQAGNLSFTYFADPAKIKLYLASGLPVLLTDVSYNAKEIEAKNCGKIVDYDAKNIAVAVINLMSDEEKLRQYRENAVNYAKQFDWNLILKNNLQEIL